jgi:NifU-like protein
LLSFVVFVYSVSPIYPKKVSERLRASTHNKRRDNADATGTAVALECGTNIKVFLSIEDSTRTISKIAFRSNGCGYMLAAADAMAEDLANKSLTELHGLRPEELSAQIKKALGERPPDRTHCVATAVDAVRNAFAEYRRARIEEFAGERALICTCFGVSEETIERAIKYDAARTVDEIGRLTNAGTGCGSCQMLINEIIDSTAESAN